MDVINKFQTSNNCRISNSSTLIQILDLGLHPLANSLRNNIDDTEEKFPLTISFCPDSSLLQLNETIDKKILFHHYVWVTGTSTSARNYAQLFHDRLVEIIDPNQKDFIVEIASNDGTFLKPFAKAGYTNILGVDPAENVALMANQRGIPTLSEFWSSVVADQLARDHGKAKVVIARNVIPHVSELLDVVLGIQMLLQENGVGIIEFHDAGKIQTELHYDSIYHEHLCYFSIASITHLLKRFDLTPFHIEKSPISGGSWVIYFSQVERNMSVELERAIYLEENSKVNNLLSWQDFAQSTAKHKQSTLDILASLEGQTIVGFGSSARSQTYLNYCGIDTNQIKVIIDNNPLKQGLYAPGSSIPIVDMESGFKLKPDLILVLAWNFRDEIANACIAAGYEGQFLVPFPIKPYLFDGENEIH